MPSSRERPIAPGGDVVDDQVQVPVLSDGAKSGPGHSRLFLTIAIQVLYIHVVVVVVVVHTCHIIHTHTHSLSKKA
jgi:hypothetical protein